MVTLQRQTNLEVLILINISAEIYCNDMICKVNVHDYLRKIFPKFQQTKVISVLSFKFLTPKHINHWLCDLNVLLTDL